MLHALFSSLAIWTFVLASRESSVASCISSRKASVAATRDLFRGSLGRIETPTCSGEPFERRRRRPVRGAEAIAQRANALDHVLRAEPVGVEKRAAAIARKAVAGE